MMPSERILVAGESASDLDVVVKLLRGEFSDVKVSANAERAAADFEQHQPSVLVLVFEAVEKAERYCLGLYRLSPLAHTLMHRTIILCGKDELGRTYDLCRKRHFDDYVLFWPANYDAPRLAMTVHHALRELASARAPSAAEFAAHARGVAQLAPLVDEHLARAGRSVERAGGSVEEAKRTFGEALGTLKRELAPALDVARALGSLAAKVRPLVLVVDDDDFQRRMIERMLAATPWETVTARCGTEALAFLRKRRADVVVMDVNLPDFDGIEATRRIKSMERNASIPVVMITGRSAKDTVVASIKAGASDFVVKPIEKSMLLAKLKAALTAPRADA